MASSSSSTTTTTYSSGCLQRPSTEHLHHHDNNDHSPTAIVWCAAGAAANPVVRRSLARTLVRGAVLRIASDLTGGTVFESIKTRVTTTREGPLEAVTNIICPLDNEHRTYSGQQASQQKKQQQQQQQPRRKYRYLALWTGTESRLVEGALVGAVFMLASSVTKTQLRAWGGSPTTAALLGGLVGGVAQASVMTPAGLVFTSLNYHRGQPGHEEDTAWTVIRRIVSTQGLAGMYAGAGPMALRQATNWASRAGLTEVARTTLKLSSKGLMGEIGSGILGGLGSCWNTPVETARVLMQRDVSAGRKPQSMMGYWNDILENGEGVPGLFRGITPRAMQAIWQTCFMVVVPNVMGI